MKKGKIVQVVGPAVDVRFDSISELPALYNALVTTIPS